MDRKKKMWLPFLLAALCVGLAIFIIFPPGRENPDPYRGETGAPVTGSIALLCGAPFVLNQVTSCKSATVSRVSVSRVKNMKGPAAAGPFVCFVPLWFRAELPQMNSRLLCHVLTKTLENCRNLCAGGAAGRHEIVVTALHEPGIY